MQRFGLLAGLIVIAWTGAGAQNLPTVYRGAALPNSEFDAASTIRVLPNGDVIEIAGSFASNVPGQFAEALGHAPLVRTVRLESPGGHVAAALAVADIIRSHGLDTYVGRFCASACTLAFLGGRHRFVAASARLGFHQASLPDVPPVRLAALLRAAYAKFGVPPGFIDHVLQIPPESAWFPNRDELTDAGFITDPTPEAAAVTDDPVSASWGESIKLVRWASDDTVVQFAQALSRLLGQLQQRGDEVCWQFMHGVPTDLTALVDRPTILAMTAALNQVREDASRTPSMGIDGETRTRLIATLIRSLPNQLQSGAREALQLEGAHESYCRSIILLMNTALLLPPEGRRPTLRAVLSDR